MTYNPDVVQEMTDRIACDLKKCPVNGQKHFFKCQEMTDKRQY